MYIRKKRVYRRSGVVGPKRIKKKEVGSSRGRGSRRGYRNIKERSMCFRMEKVNVEVWGVEVTCLLLREILGVKNL